MSSDEEEHPFQLVHFVKPGRKSVRVTDIVPSSWVIFIKGTFKTKFMPDPYTEDDIKLLRNLVKKELPPPENWPYYTVRPLGNAKTYEEAESRLADLKIKEFAFSTDAEMTPFEKAQKNEKKIREKKFSVSNDARSKLKNIDDLKSDVDDDTLQNNKKQWSENLTSARRKTRKTPELLSNSDSEDLDEIHLSKRSQMSSIKLKKSKKKGSSKHNLVRNGTKSKELESSLLEINKNTAGPSTASGSFIHQPNDKEVESSLGKVGKNSCPSTKKSATLKSTVVLSRNKKAVNVSRKFSNGKPSKSLGEIVIRKLDDMAVDIKDIKKNQRKQTQNSYAHQIESAVDFVRENKLILPFKEAKDFENFDSKLLADTQFEEKFKNSLPLEFDPKMNLRASMKNIIKKYLSKELVKNYTVSRHKGVRSLFSDTQMYKSIMIVLQNTHLDVPSGGKKCISEQYISSEMGKVFASAVDWDGGRRERQKKATSKKETQTKKGHGNENSDESSSKYDDISAQDDSESDNNYTGGNDQDNFDQMSFD